MDFRLLLVEQLCAPVLWQDSMQWMLAQDFDTFLEIGPGRVLKGLLKRIDKSASCEVITE
jgi:[acyl-carrier-protein] S-malonyltransferase